METYGKSLNSVFLFRMRTATLMTALCVFMLAAGAANAVTYTDSSPQTTEGQNFIFTFSPVNPWNGGTGTFTVHARGDYTVGTSSEYLDWDIEGLVSDLAAPSAGGTVIQEFNSNDIEWEQSFTINGGLLNAITSDSSIAISIDLSGSVDYQIDPSKHFVEVELTYNASGSPCPPPPAPDNPDPCDGATEVPVDTCLSWSESGTPPPGQGVIEDFEDGGMTEYTILGGSHIVNGNAAHDGVLGLESDGSGWTYRHDPQVLVGQGDTFSLWVCVRSNRRAYCGFGASSAGTYSIVAAPNTNQLLLQRNSGFNYSDIGSVSHAWQLNKWYLMEVQWEVGGNMTGRLYDSDGSTLLKTVTATDNIYTSGGIAFRSLGNVSNYFDTVQRSGPSPLATQVPLEPLTSGPVVLEPRDPADAIGWDEQNGAFIFESQNIEPGLDEHDSSAMNPGGVQTLQGESLLSTSCFTFGGAQESWSGDSRLRANIITVDAQQTLSEIKMELSFSDNCDLYFYVFESSSETGPYTPVMETVVETVGIGRAFYSSGPTNFVLNPGSYYGIGVAWGASSSVTYYRNRVTLPTPWNLGMVAGYLYANTGPPYTGPIIEDPLFFAVYSLELCFGSEPPPPPCPTTWDLHLGTDPCVLEVVASNLTDPCYCPGGLETGETYFWQVIAKNSSGETLGNVWTFETEGGDPPNCSNAVPSVAEIWPPRHEWVDIEILDVDDPDGDPVSITITGITQDEPVAGHGSGRTSPDGMGIGTSVAHVRAERSGQSDNGRVYEISFEADDGTGNTCNGSVKVCVPHDQGQGHECVDDGQLYDSTATEMFSVDLNGDGIINQLDFNILVEYWLVSYELED